MQENNQSESQRVESRRRVVTMSGRFEQRNLTVKHIRDLKGQRVLTQILPSCPEDAMAAVAAGIDWLDVRYEPAYPHRAAAIRQAAPHTFMSFAMPLNAVCNATEALRMAFEAIEHGADSIMCPWSLEFVEALAKSDIPVQGHVGLVPRKSMTTGGLRAMGKTNAEALKIFSDIKALENAGAWAVECEVMPSKLMALLSLNTAMTTVSIGAGAGADAQFLFAEDILGDRSKPYPRHSKQYCDLQALRKQMQQTRIHAFKDYAAEVESGEFPSKPYEVDVADEVLESLSQHMQKVRQL